jgi:RNA polymerase sigma-70 factor (sigma-E family)
MTSSRCSSPEITPRPDKSARFQSGRGGGDSDLHALTIVGQRIGELLRLVGVGLQEGAGVRFEAFARARVPVLLRTAVALSGDLGLAEDLVQDVLLKAHQRWDRISRLDAPESYLRRMLVNEFLSWRRKWARVIPSEEVVAVDQHPDHASAHADRQLLRDEINRLPKHQRTVLALRYYARLSDAEIAEAMGCRTSSVRAFASRALAPLRVEPALRVEYFVPAEKEGPA